MKSVHQRAGGLAFLLAGAAAWLAPSAFADGAKKPGYAFNRPPLEILAKLNAAEFAQAEPLPEDERKFLAEIWELRKSGKAELKADDPRIAEAMLFASGVADPAKRQGYAKKIAALQAKARTAAQAAKNDRERGEIVMKFLHQEIMAKGYVSAQTSLAVLLDEGKGNCVSSAAMYWLLAAPLGMELKIISIPGSRYLAGHATLDLVDGGQRVQVEPTCANGFDWGTKVSKPGVIVLGHVPDRKNGYEIDGFGLAGAIYANRAAALGKTKKPEHAAAAQCAIAALALSPDDVTANGNLLAEFVNWGPALADAQDFEAATQAAAFGLQFAPNDRGLNNNRQAVWGRYIRALAERDDFAGAVKVIARAKDATGSRDFADVSRCILGECERKLEKGWEDGLAAAEKAMPALPEADAKKVSAWRVGVCRRWSQKLLSGKTPDVAGSLQALLRAAALGVDEREVNAGVRLHTQEALRILSVSGGPKAAADHLRELRERFPNLKGLDELAWSYASNSVRKLTEAGKFKEATELTLAYAPLLAKPEQREELGALVYAEWARKLAGDKKPEAALEKCAEGLKAFPKQERLLSAARRTVDGWADPSFKSGDWDEAIRIYRVGLKAAPEDAHLKKNLSICLERKEKKK